MAKEGVDMGMFFDDKEFEKMMKLKVSTNYHFCNSFLPGLFFYKPEIFMMCFKDETILNKLIGIVLDAMKEEGFDTTGFDNLNHWFKVDKENEIMGIILEIPNPQIEPECNYVCLTFKKDEPILYESELYDEGVFGLCARTKDGGHMNYGIQEDIRTPEQMWNAILDLFDDK